MLVKSTKSASSMSTTLIAEVPLPTVPVKPIHSKAVPKGERGLLTTGAVGAIFSRVDSEVLVDVRTDLVPKGDQFLRCDGPIRNTKSTKKTQLDRQNRANCSSQPVAIVQLVNSVVQRASPG